MIEKIKASFFGSTEIYAWIETNIFSHSKFYLILIGVLCLAILHSNIIARLLGLIKLRMNSYSALTVVKNLIVTEKIVDRFIKAVVVISGFFIALDPVKFFSNFKNPLPWEFFNFIETKTVLWIINLLFSGVLLFFFGVLLSVFIGVIYWIATDEKQIIRNSWNTLKIMFICTIYTVFVYCGLMFIFFLGTLAG